MRALSGGTIRRRVARILALPAVVILVLLGVVTAGQIGEYRSSRDASHSAELALAVQDLVHEMQNERGITAAVLGGNTGFRDELAPVRKAVDEQRERLDGLVDGDGAHEPGIREAVQQLDGLPSVRAATDGNTAGRAETFDYYTTRIGGLARIQAGLDQTGDETLRRGAATLLAVGDLAEAISQERAFLNGVFSVGAFGRGDFVRFADMRARKQEALRRFDSTATAEQRKSRDFVLDTGAARLTAYFEQVAIDAFDGRRLSVNPQSWWSGQTTVLDDLRRLQQHVGSQIQVQAYEQQTDAGQRIALLVLVVLACFGGSAYLVMLASLSITRPLAELAAEADSVAADRLQAAVEAAQNADEDHPPKPPARVQVPSRATHEIRSVALALDRMQSVAYQLAAEQAMQRRRTIESLRNLGHRNQNLIRRQLGFITTLEREEIDPNALANLFELDHLATRMRRNAASLLVLVGASSPRQWASPVPVADVIRAAVSEVEEYRRVALRRVDDALVTGNAVGAVAHLLSELIENGLTFSPPDTEVEIHGRWAGDGYLIAITDAGIGMIEEDITVANARLRGEGDFIAAPTRFLGHFVVGQLSRETGTRVELRPSPVTGITARVTLPETILVRPMVIEAPAAALTDSPATPRLTAGPARSQPAVPARPAHPVRAAAPERPAVRPNPVLPALEAMQPLQAARIQPPARPATLSERPAKPAAPERPAKPAAPERPAKPAAPERPAKPAAPERPAKPTAPERPAKPAAPERPAKPTGPERTTQPDRPAATASRPALPAPTGPDTGSWGIPSAFTMDDDPVPNGTGTGKELATRPAAMPATAAKPATSAKPGTAEPAARGKSGPGYDDTVFGTGPYGTGPIPTIADPLRPSPSIGVPLTPGGGVRASSVGLRSGTPGSRSGSGSGPGSGPVSAEDDAAAGVERTANGLRKRVRRAPLPEGVVPTPPKGIIRPSPHPAPPVIDDSPDMVRNRIMALRAGIERGAQQGGLSNRMSDGDARGPAAPRGTGGADNDAEEPG